MKINININIKQTFTCISEYFSPKIIGEVNDVYIKTAKIKGDKIPWHHHKNEDELFYIIEGNLFFEVEGQEGFMMEEGEMYIVKKGINHKVSSIEECKIMLVEHKTTAHTGNIISDITKTIQEQK